MKDQLVSIIVRRFVSRLAESGLLILTAALGVGAAAAGLALVLDTQAYARELLHSPAYQEIVVSTPSASPDMESPILEQQVDQTLVLTVSDLAVAEMIDEIAYAYIAVDTGIQLVTAESIAEQQSREQQFAAMAQSLPEGETQPSEGPAHEQPEGGFRQEVDLETLETDETILLAEIERLSGYEVSSEYFDAWQLETAYGSLFSASDYEDTDSVIVLGSQTAVLLAGEEDPFWLLGKRLVTKSGYQTIIGILSETGEEIDTMVLLPYRSLSSRFTMLRTPGMGTALRFYVPEVEELQYVSETLTEWFEAQSAQGSFVISNPRAEALELVERNTGISFALAFLAAAGLFIAAVNVSNILMSRTLRMKHHVGIMMALGASRARVISLFAFEAGLVCLSGSLVGGLLSIPMLSALEQTLSLSSGYESYILIGTAISGLVTFTFSILPVRQFASIAPAEAFRSA